MKASDVRHCLPIIDHYGEFPEEPTIKTAIDCLGNTIEPGDYFLRMMRDSRVMVCRCIGPSKNGAFPCRAVNAAHWLLLIEAGGRPDFFYLLEGGRCVKIHDSYIPAALSDFLNASHRPNKTDSVLQVPEVRKQNGLEVSQEGKQDGGTVHDQGVRPLCGLSSGEAGQGAQRKRACQEGQGEAGEVEGGEGE